MAHYLKGSNNLDNIIIIAGVTEEGTAVTTMMAEQVGSVYANQQMMRDQLEIAKDDLIWGDNLDVEESEGMDI